MARTRNRRPLTLVLVEYFDSSTAARRRELFLKTGVGRAWLKARVAPGDLVYLKASRAVGLERIVELWDAPFSS